MPDSDNEDLCEKHKAQKRASKNHNEDLSFVRRVKRKLESLGDDEFSSPPSQLLSDRRYIEHLKLGGYADFEEPDKENNAVKGRVLETHDGNVLLPVRR